MAGSTVRFVIPVYPQTTHLDFTGPHQFFSRVPNAEVIVASRAGGDLTLDGLTFAGLPRLADIDRCDVICVPGGFGTAQSIEDSDYMAEVKRLAGSARYITSVCTGSLILAAAGLLKGKRAACHWYWRDLLGKFPGVTVVDDRVVRDGNVISGGGVTAGIDFALAVIAEVAGTDTAELIQLGLEYAPEPPFNSGRPDSAPTQIVDSLRGRFEGMTKDNRARIEGFIARLA